MPARRMPSSRPERSGRPASQRGLARSRIGITTSLQTMVERVRVSNMIMLVAADSPPRKASSARFGICSAIGRASTNMSASTPPLSNTSRPPRAIGSTNRLMANKYSGNSQIALRIWASLTFSTTST